MEIKRILGTDKGKDAFYKADDNFVAIQADAQAKDILLGSEELSTVAQTVKGAINENKNAIDAIEGQVAQATYASVTKQEPVLSLGADAIKGQVPINAKGLSVVNMLNVCNISSTIAISSVVAIYPQKDGTLSTGTSNLNSVSLVAGHRYFIKVKLKPTSAVNIDRVIVGTLGASGFNSKEVYAIITPPTNLTSNLYTQTSVGQTGNLITDYALVYDLTQAGLNNLTAEQANNLLGYVSGIGSVNDTKVKSVGKNIFKMPVGLGDFDYNHLSLCKVYKSGEFTVIEGKPSNVAFANSKLFRVKKNTNYMLSISGYKEVGTKGTVDIMRESDFETSGNSPVSIAISDTDSIINTLFNSGDSNYMRVRFYPTGSGAGSTSKMFVRSLQIAEGTVGTTIEPYVESISPLPDLRSLPNGVKDEVVEGKFIKRVGEHVVKASDITTYNNASYTTYDFTTIAKPILADSSVWTNAIENKLIVQGFPAETVNVGTDDVSRVGSFTTSASTLHFIVAKGAYANLTAAQTALAGTKILYELAVPIVEGLVTPLTVFPKGTISIESDSETTIPELTLNYPINTAGAIEKLNDAVNQITKVIHEEAQWITATLQNGWTGILRYRKNQIGLIELAWELTPGTVTSGTVISQLPSDYFPAGITALLSIKNTDASTVRGLVITADGKIVVRMTEITSGANYLGTAVLRGV